MAVGGGPGDDLSRTERDVDAIAVAQRWRRDDGRRAEIDRPASGDGQHGRFAARAVRWSESQQQWQKGEQPTTSSGA